MLRDHGTWSASLSCWLSTVDCSLERRTESLWMSYLLRSTHQKGGRAVCPDDRRGMRRSTSIGTESLWRHRCCCSHVGNCATVRDYVRSWRISRARAQQKYYTADIRIPLCREEVLIIFILTSDVVLQRDSRVTGHSSWAVTVWNWMTVLVWMVSFRSGSLRVVVSK